MGTGHLSLARKTLQPVRESDTVLETLNPQIFLYISNAFSAPPGEQLNCLNRFFIAKGLSPVTLKNFHEPVSVHNLKEIPSLSEIRDGPLVSILVTAYNTGSYICAALESLLNQTYRNLEIIVVDDCSSDDTPGMIAGIAAHEDRVKLVRLKNNVGTFIAKSIGLQHAKGAFVTCHDSDDWAHPERLARQVIPLLQNDKLVATTSQWLRVRDDGFFYARAVYPMSRLNPASPLFRRKIVKDTMGMWDAVRTGADSEFYTRLNLIFGREAVQRVQLPLTLGAHRPDSLMTNSITGYQTTGMPLTRLKYWEAWTRWHINELRHGKKPVMPDYCEFDSIRPFSAPDEIAVNPELIGQNIHYLKNSEI